MTDTTYICQIFALQIFSPSLRLSFNFLNSVFANGVFWRVDVFIYAQVQIFVMLLCAKKIVSKNEQFNVNNTHLIYFKKE